MGIPKFFKFINERYPCLGETLKDYQIPEFDNFYLDVNGIIHGCSHPNDSDVTFRISEETIFTNIFHYIEVLFHTIQPQKLLFIAIDGVAPRAKINQQRRRRFMQSKTVEAQEADAKAKGIELPKEKRFDSNCITPGTLFMAKLDEQLKYFITCKISTNKLWQRCKVIFSGSQVAGEGEHKIIDYIRYMKSQPDYDPFTRHCLYGLDADLIMLGLCTHEMYFTLLRNEVLFTKKITKIITLEESPFCVLHVSLLRDYIDHELSPVKEKLPFPYDIEKIIDDWVLMGFLVGNDFIPHLPNLHIAHDALSILYQVYIDVLPTLGGYINESGTLKLDRFEKFMKRLSLFDVLQFTKNYADLKYFESKTGRRLTESNKSSCQMLDDNEKMLSPKMVEEFSALLSFSASFGANMSPEKYDDDGAEDEESDSETYSMEFVQHKRDYYMNKLEYENIDKDFLRSQAECYVKAIQWNLHYYYNGCCSWSWYYPHHYAPYISDIKDFKDLKLEFDLGEPFLPFEQLLAVLPPYSKSLLPKAFQTLLTDEKSPIINYYPTDFKLDLNGKRQQWEAVVLIPFIDEKQLLDAMAPHYPKLTSEERARNKHGPMYLYSYTEENMGVYLAPEYFSDIASSHAKRQSINREDIIVPRDKLVKGLCPNVKLDVFCPGFPRLRYIDHTASISMNNIKVFNKPSRNESLILHIRPPPYVTADLITAAFHLLGKTVFVNWPYLSEARVVGISNCDTRLNLLNPQVIYSHKNVKEEKLTGPLSVQWYTQKKHISEVYKNIRGIEIGNIDILVHALPLIGSKYTFGSDGKLCFDKQWSDSQTLYAYQTIVKDITVHYVNTMLYKTIDDIFVPGIVCFMLGHPHYGSVGNVVEPAVCKKSGRIRVLVNVTPEPSLDVVKQIYQELKTQYMPKDVAARWLGISSHILTRITGTLYVKQASDELFNIGLNLKYTKKNEEVSGYTRKEDSCWLYSSKAIDLIRSYMVKNPTLFERLAHLCSSHNVIDIIDEEALFDKGSRELYDIVAWLKEKLQGLQVRPCGIDTLDTNLVKKVEQVVDEFFKTQGNAVKMVPMQVKPHLLFKPGLHLRNTPPDPKAQTHLLDRVCNVKDNFTVPLGYKGTVVGIQKSDTALNTMYDILFDKPVPGGMSISGSSEFRAYRLSTIDFINISHGERIEHGRVRAEDVNAESVDDWKYATNQKGQSCANASAFASYRKKNHSPAEPPTSPKLRIIQRNSEEQDQALRLAPPSNIYKWKQCNMENAGMNSWDAYKTANAQQNQVTKNAQKRQPTAKPSLEFQALWNELHKPQKPNEPPKTPIQAPMGSKVKQINEGFPESSPQDPSAFLKAVLKISDENTRQRAHSMPPKTPSSNAVPQKVDTPPLVQQLFDHARQNEKVKDKRTPIWYCSQLLNYYQLSGVGMPRYSYFTDGETNLIRAHILLPDKRVFVGDPCTNHEQAAGSAAEKVYTELNLANVLPNMKTLLPPPLHWYSNRQNNSWSQNIRPPGVPTFHTPKPQPPQHYLQWPLKMQHNPGYQQVSKQNNQYKHHSQPKLAHNESRSEIKNSTSFVPLQAQKKNRNIIAKQGDTKEANQCAKDNLPPVAQQKKELPAKKVKIVAATAEKQKSAPSSSHQVQNIQNTIKPKKSRVAAKFCIPSQTEETNHNKKYT